MHIRWFLMNTCSVAAAILVMIVQTLISRPPPGPGAGGPGAERFESFAAKVAQVADSAGRSRAVTALVSLVRQAGTVMAEDSEVTLIYRGTARHVFVAGDPNGWEPGADEMKRLPGTDLFSLSWKLDPAARFEYKLVVDSAWILDPLNTLRASGGFGENSEVRMPRYRFPRETVPRGDIAHGSIDTTSFTRAVSGRRTTVFVYLPAGYRSGMERYPVLYVTDGGEYLSRANMNVVLDNLIAQGEIFPLIAVFIDPRTDPADPRTNTRMTDYALNDNFIDALSGELRPVLMKRYRIMDGPRNTAIMGASMGGLIATYAAFAHPEIFGLCAAQSPSYQWKNDTLITMLRTAPVKNFRMYLCTGTIRDAERRARVVRDIMREKGYAITYAEYPESHNWLNWRGRLGDILRTFWGTR
jgi:enterochelin esterase family protein